VPDLTLGARGVPSPRAKKPIPFVERTCKKMKRLLTNRHSDWSRPHAGIAARPTRDWDLLSTEQVHAVFMLVSIDQAAMKASLGHDTGPQHLDRSLSRAIPRRRRDLGVSTPLGSSDATGSRNRAPPFIKVDYFS